jgi:hypothetical protein
MPLEARKICKSGEAETPAVTGDTPSDSRLAQRQELDRVLRRESEGVLEIIVIRAREIGLWHQAISQGDEIAARNPLPYLFGGNPSGMSGFDSSGASSYFGPGVNPSYY